MGTFRRNADASAFTADGEYMCEGGLTKREYIATQIMASLVSNPAVDLDPDTVLALAEGANQCADALLESWEDTRE
jgi:hypothetical protein